jgi:hypothetical protein
MATLETNVNGNTTATFDTTVTLESVLMISTHDVGFPNELVRKSFGLAFPNPHHNDDSLAL